MKLVFALFKYFPHGGLQRDMVRIARACMARGHSVQVLAMVVQGEVPDDLPITVLPVRGITNHTRCRNFGRAVLAQRPADAVLVGFNRMPGLDVYYAADGCFEARARDQRPAWYRWLPRYRTFAAMERAVFAPGADTDILLISEPQGAEFRRCYNTPVERFHALPPGLDRDRMAPDPAGAAALRASTRAGLGLADDAHVALLVGSGFRTKGVDRAIRALAALPAPLRASSHLLVAGADRAEPFRRLARQLGVAERVHFLGARDDVPALLQAADVLVHPAYAENTGTVLLEAVVAGLPVLTTAVCGYAGHITAADAGVVLPEPFDQAAMAAALGHMLVAPEREQWRANGIAYGQSADLYSLAERAVDVIEQRQATP